MSKEGNGTAVALRAQGTSGGRQRVAPCTGAASSDLITTLARLCGHQLIQRAHAALQQFERNRTDIIVGGSDCGPYLPQTAGHICLKQSFDGTSDQLRRCNNGVNFQHGDMRGGSRAIRGGQLRRTSSLVIVAFWVRLREGSANDACALGCRGECL